MLQKMRLCPEDAQAEDEPGLLGSSDDDGSADGESELSSLCETVEEVPEPSAPMPALADIEDPVRVLTRLQALRIENGRDPPRPNT